MLTKYFKEIRHYNENWKTKYLHCNKPLSNLNQQEFHILSNFYNSNLEKDVFKLLDNPDHIQHSEVIIMMQNQTQNYCRICGGESFHTV